MESRFDTVVGLEIHVQLNTESKAFSSDKNQFGCDPNTNLSAVSIALPGALPKVNRSQVFSAIKLGLALESEINKASSFDRKNYFYPDSPKGYQITQDASPIVIGGQFTFRTGDKTKTIRIHHVHMEDDAGKSIHDLHSDYSAIDLNRAGTPLLEVVTEPDFDSGQEVSDFLAAFQILLRYLEISDANMEEGSMRCDCNVSIKPEGSPTLGTRCEIKNVNSKKFAKIAIEYESQRHQELILSGGSVEQESRLFDSKKSVTFTMRKKEDALDYRYFPDPDLQPIIVSDEMISNIKSGITMLPWTAKETLQENGVSEQNAAALAVNKDFVMYFTTINHYLQSPKLVSDFLLNHIAPRWNSLHDFDHHAAKDKWIELLQLVADKKVSPSTAYQKLVPEIIENHEQSVLVLAKKYNLIIQSTDSNELSELCAELLKEFPEKAAAYKKGKKGLMGFFMGQAMRKGKNYDPKALQQEFEKQLL